MEKEIIQYILYLVILVLLAIPLGKYIGKVMNGEKTVLSVVLMPCEKVIYRFLKIDDKEEMTWKKYAASVLGVSAVSFIILFIIILCQGILPMNPEKIKELMFSWLLIQQSVL